MKEQAESSVNLPTTLFVRTVVVRAYIRAHFFFALLLVLISLGSFYGVFLTAFTISFLLLFAVLDHFYDAGKVQPDSYKKLIRYFSYSWLYSSSFLFLYAIGTFPSSRLLTDYARTVFTVLMQIFSVNQALAFSTGFHCILHTLLIPLLTVYLTFSSDFSQAVLCITVCTAAYVNFMITRHTPSKMACECSTQTDSIHTMHSAESYVITKAFEYFPYPSFIIDVDINPAAAGPPIINSHGKSLLKFHNHSSCNSLLSSLAIGNTFRNAIDLVNIMKRKVEQQCIYKDKATLTTNYTRYNFDITLFSFEIPDEALSKDFRYVAIALIPMTKDPLEEKLIMENFKGSLICSLSHELCTPINTILNLLKVMPACLNKEGSCDLRDIAISNTELLNSKLQDLIDYTQIELGSFKPVERNFCVDDLLCELQQIFKYESEQKQNELILETNSKSKLWVMADRRRIRQVLIKLITNANKYTRKGQIIVSAIENSDNFDVIFQVKDTGAGIAKQQLDLIFSNISETTRLQTNHRAGSTKLPGLGLAIARRICKSMNSRLKAKSTVGKGSMFYFELPICKMPTGDREGESCEDLEPKTRGTIFRQLATRSISNSKVTEALGQDATALDRLRNGMSFRIVKAREAGTGESVGKVLEECKDEGKMAQAPQTINLPKEEPEVRKDKRKAYKHQLSTNVVEHLIPANLGQTPPEPEYQEQVSVKKPEHNIVTPANNGKAGVVLIADDYAGNRLVLAQMLEKLHVKSIQAVNGLETCKIVGKFIEELSPAEQIELILMDIDMPEMDGIQATNRIRSMEERNKRPSRIPIVAVTAFNSENDKQMCIQAGMQHFLPKPVHYTALKNLAKTYCKAYQEVK